MQIFTVFLYRGRPQPRFYKIKGCLQLHAVFGVQGFMKWGSRILLLDQTPCSYADAALLFVEPVPVVDERLLWVFLLYQTLGIGLQTRCLCERHTLTVTSIAGYRATQVFVLFVFTCMSADCSFFQILISISSIKEKLYYSNAVLSTCITAVTVAACFLQVAGDASGALLEEEKRQWLFQLQTVCCVVLSGCGPGLAPTGVEIS